MKKIVKEVAKVLVNGSVAQFGDPVPVTMDHETQSTL